MTLRLTSRWTSRLRLAGVLIVLLVVAAGAAQLVLPTLVEQRLEDAIQGSFEDVKVARVEVQAFPAVALLAGRLSSISIDARRATLDGLTIDAIMLDGRNLQVDMMRLLAGEGIALRSAEHLKATLAITEDDLNRYFWEILNQSQFFTVTLKRGTATLAGRFRMLGRELDLEVSGHFKVHDGTTVTFVPHDASLANARLPQMFLDMITEEWHIPLRLDQQVIPLAINDLLVEDGKLFIYGTHPQ